MLLAGVLALEAALSGPALAVVTSRQVFFNSVAFRDCYLSIYNPSAVSVLVSVTIGATSGDGVNSWAGSLAYANSDGALGATAGAPPYTITAGKTLQLAYTKGSDYAGTFWGWISVSSAGPINGAVGAIVASGYCVSEKTHIPFTITGGRAF